MEYFILKPNGEQTGTFSIEQIRAMLEKGVIGPETQYWHEGIEGWRPITRIEESLHFQPPAPTAQPSTKPQPLKFPPTSRAVLRPYSTLKKSSGPLVQPGTTQTRPPTRKLVPNPVQNQTPSQPKTSARTEPIRAEPAPPVVVKKRRILNWVLYAVSVVVVALAIDYGEPLLQTATHLFQSEITLNSNETYVLLNPAEIKSFTNDMRNFPPLDNLRHQMEQATDPASRAGLALAVQKSALFHANEVEQRYLAMRKAERIPSGTYKVLKRFDDQGNPTLFPRGTSIWYAISYQGQTVYAHKAADTPTP
jgi:hypothetical protein